MRLLSTNRETATSSTESSPTSAANSLPLSIPLRLPPELTNNSKFAFAFPDEPGTSSLPLIPPNEEVADSDTKTETHTTENQDATPSPGMDLLSPTPLPRLERAFSTPVASQLGHLKHPRRPPGFGSPSSSFGGSQPYTPGLSTIYSAPASAIPLDYVTRERSLPFSGLSLELADTAQLIIQTLLQLSPPHLLDPAHEQFSGCTLQVPTTSVGAMLTAMKGLNWMSVRLAGFADDDNTGLESVVQDDKKDEVFDVGEMLQSVGDVLGGIAAQAGIDVVIYHADVGIKHVGVKGEEGGVSYALSHIVRQIIAVAEPGDTIDLGLQLETREGDSVICTFDIIHRLGPYIPSQPPHFEHRVPPQFDTPILRKLLTHIHATLKAKPVQPPSSPSLTATSATLAPSPHLPSPQPTFSYTLTIPFKSSPAPLTVPPLSAAEEAERQPFPTIKLAYEPTLDELARFAEKELRGKRATFYANATSGFAHHLTSYLTAWGMNVEHRAVGRGAGEDTNKEDGIMGRVTNETDTPLGGETAGAADSTSSTGLAPNSSFIIIDDDVTILRKRLIQLRVESSPAIPATVSRKRPNLAANHRPRSSPQIRQLIGIPEMPAPGSGTVIVHFTSLANFKMVRDIVQSVLFTSPGCGPSPAMMVGGAWGGPEVLVIPKPAGPRRFLTALHTATTKPMVDPAFSPIATSPMSPSAHSHTPSPRSHRGSPAAGGGKLQPSPLSVESLEYFSQTAEMVLESTSPENARSAGGSGVVLQDLEGRPAGILFQPKPRAERDGLSPTTASNGSTATGARAQTGNGIGSRRTLTLEGTLRAASPVGSKGDGGIRKSAPSSPTTPLSAGGVVSIRRASGDAVGDAGNGGLGPGTPARSVGTGLAGNPQSGTALGTAGTSTQPAIVRTTSGSRINRPRQNSGNKIDLLAGSSVGDPVVRKEPTASRRTSGASGVGLDGALTPKKPEGTPRRRTSGADGKSPGAAGVASSGKAIGKKPKGKDSGIVPPINVLIVEDNPINQTILSTFIKRKKIKCEVAQNGLQAVEKWKTGKFHLIFMDIQMPVMDGIEATREIRRLEKVQQIGSMSTPPIESPSLLADSKQLFTSPAQDATKLFMSGPSSPFRSSVVIVALTASSLQSDRVTALAAGCNDFLTKPVALDWLDKKIIEWGSIKALQMWAEPEMARHFQKGQDAKAKAVATHLRIERPLSRLKPIARKPSQDNGGVQIHIQAPTPPIVDIPPPQNTQKPPLSRSITKSPSPLSSSMVLPTEPPPPPVPTEAETPVGNNVETDKQADPEGASGALEAVDAALEDHLEKIDKSPAVLQTVPEASSDSGTKPVDQEIPESSDQVPELVLDAPNTLAEHESTAPTDIIPTDIPLPNPDRYRSPISPAETAILTDTPYLSADSIPPSPGNCSS